MQMQLCTACEIYEYTECFSVEALTVVPAPVWLSLSQFLLHHVSTTLMIIKQSMMQLVKWLSASSCILGERLAFSNLSCPLVSAPSFPSTVSVFFFSQPIYFCFFSTRNDPKRLMLFWKMTVGHILSISSRLGGDCLFCSFQLIYHADIFI